MAIKTDAAAEAARRAEARRIAEEAARRAAAAAAAARARSAAAAATKAKAAAAKRNDEFSTGMGKKLRVAALGGRPIPTASAPRLDVKAPQTADQNPALKADVDAANALKQKATAANDQATQFDTKAKASAQAAQSAQAQLQAVQTQLDTVDSPRRAQALSKQLPATKAKADEAAQTARSDQQAASAARQDALKLSQQTLEAQKVANADVPTIKLPLGLKIPTQPRPFPDADRFDNVVDLASDPAAAQRLLGTPPPVAPEQAALYAAHKVIAATVQGPVQGSQALADQLAQNPDPTYRAALLANVQPAIQTIALDATRGPKPNEAELMTIAQNLSAAGAAAGPKGAAIIAANVAPYLGDAELTATGDKDGKPTFNGSNLDGALANAAMIGSDQTLFRSIPAAMQQIGKSDSADWKVNPPHDGGVLGFVEDVGSFITHLPGDVVDAFKAVGGAAIHGVEDLAQGAYNGVKGAAEFVGDKLQQFDKFLLDKAFEPLTNPVNDQIDQLGKGDTFSVAAFGSVDLGVHGAAEGQLSIHKNDDGTYSVAAGLDLDVGLGEKLGLGGDAAVGGGGRAEFKFTNAEDAKRAADVFVRLAASTAIPGVGTLAVGVGELADGDVGFLKDHLSAVELKGEAVAQAKENLGIKEPAGGTAGVTADAKAQATAGLRIEFENGKPKAAIFGEQVAADASASAGLKDAAALDASAGVSLTIQDRVELKDGVSLSDLTHPGKVLDKFRQGEIQTSVTASFEESGGAEVGSTVNAQAGAGVSGHLTFNGNPEQILKAIPDVLGAVRSGNFGDVAKIVGSDIGVSGSVTPQQVTTGGFDVDLKVVAFGVKTTRTHEGDPLAQFSSGPVESAADEAGGGQFENFLNTTAES